MGSCILEGLYSTLYPARAMAHPGARDDAVRGEAQWLRLDVGGNLGYGPMTETGLDL
jgi:hypothetical protein